MKLMDGISGELSWKEANEVSSYHDTRHRKVILGCVACHISSPVFSFPIYKWELWTRSGTVTASCLFGNYNIAHTFRKPLLPQFSPCSFVGADPFLSRASRGRPMARTGNEILYILSHSGLELAHN